MKGFSVLPCILKRRKKRDFGCSGVDLGSESLESGFLAEPVLVGREKELLELERSWSRGFSWGRGGEVVVFSS